jgi:large subunit ribosomal protein L21
MKYAIVESGGKQYRVEEGATIEVDHLPVEIDKKVKLDSVLLLVEDDKFLIGNPTVKGARVDVTVVGHDKGPKLIIFKYKAKKRRRVKTGHRQQYTQLKIESVKKE